MKKILITGSNGQLGTVISQLVAEYPQLELIFCNRAELDLENDASILSALERHCPDSVINCAAYTAVDRAEDERELAMRINGYAVGTLARACEKIGASLIQISTDYIFGGNQNQPYPVDFLPRPINYYGETKLEGERQAIANCSKTLIVRTAWLYSDYGDNFANTMRRLFQEKEEIRVVNDQIGQPTNADLLARFCLNAVTADPMPAGVEHISGPEIMSWYDFACLLYRSAELPVTQRIIPINSSEYPTRAVRPKYSVLDLSNPENS